MAATKKQKPYETKAVISKISATSRASLKIRDNFFTIEYSEERIIPDIEGIDVEKERQILWDVVNNEVDTQAADIKKTFS